MSRIFTTVFTSSNYRCLSTLCTNLYQYDYTVSATKCNSERSIFIEIKINKEVRDYQESIFFGLSLRQFICSAMAIAVAVLLYFLLGRILGSGEVGWVCILAAFPFAICGFFRYNVMYFEQFAWAFIRSELLYPRQLVYKSENLYAKALADGSLKEVLALD